MSALGSCIIGEGMYYWMGKGGLVVHTAVHAKYGSWRGEILEVKL